MSVTAFKQHVKDVIKYGEKYFIAENIQRFLKSKSSNKNIVTCDNKYHHTQLTLVDKPAIIVERKTRYLSSNLP